MLICLRVRGCEFDFLLPFANRSNQPGSSDSANGFVRNQSQMPDGDLVIMTDIVDVLPHNGSNNNSRLRSGNYVWKNKSMNQNCPIYFICRLKEFQSFVPPLNTYENFPHFFMLFPRRQACLLHLLRHQKSNWIFGLNELQIWPHEISMQHQFLNCFAQIQKVGWELWLENCCLKRYRRKNHSELLLSAKKKLIISCIIHIL